MQFTEQDIVIKKYGDRQETIKAMVGEGSGLAYYQGEEGYVITTTRSGYAVIALQNLTTIFTVQMAYEEDIAQRFIVCIASFLSWGEDHAACLIDQAEKRFPHEGIRQALRSAFHEVCTQRETCTH